MTMDTSQLIAERLIEVGRSWLFLDYDGTLAEFAPTPDDVVPDREVIELVTQLAQQPTLRVGVISGRRLSQIRTLIPVPNVLLAGTYGIELQLLGGERCDRLALDQVRPSLDQLKPRWAHLIAGRQGFFLEDKGWSLALHARFAEAAEADEVLSSARRRTAEILAPDRFQWLDGHRFLEFGPRLLDKGATVNYILDRYAWPGAMPCYIGDDDKDEAAFAAIKVHHGLALVVAAQPRATLADGRLTSPAAVRHWLSELIIGLDRRQSGQLMDRLS